MAGSNQLCIMVHPVVDRGDSKHSERGFIGQEKKTFLLDFLNLGFAASKT